MREGWLQEALDSWERWVGIGGGGGEGVMFLWSQPARVLMSLLLRNHQ